MIVDVIEFLQDPANTIIFYGISAFLVFDGLLLHVVRKKLINKATGGGVVVGGNSSGIIVTGKVKGDVSQHRQTSASTPDSPSPNAFKKAQTTDRTLSILANFSAIAGLILATLTFYLTFYSGSP